MSNTGTKKQISGSQVTLLKERLASDDEELAAQGVRSINQFINLGFAIPSEITNLVIERLREVSVDHMTVNDVSMVVLLERLGIELPDYEEPGLTDYEIEQEEGRGDGQQIPGA